MLSGALMRPRCGPNSFVLRRNAMIHALEEVELSDTAVFQLFVDRAAFGAGHPYARPVFGTIDDLKLLSLNQIKDRQKQVITPVGTTLLIVGDVKPGPTLDAVEQTFGFWPTRRPPRPRPIRPPALRSRGRAFLIPRTPARSMLVCATRPLSDIRGRDAGLEVLAQILGGSLDSRLGTGLRMNSGLSYSFSASVLERRHARALVACTLVRTKDTAPALTVFKTELQRLASAPPSQAELERAKAQLLAVKGAANSSVQATVARWTRALAQGQNRPADTRAAIRDITVDTVHALAKKVLRTGTVRYVLGGTPSTAREAAQVAGLGRMRTVRLDL